MSAELVELAEPARWPLGLRDRAPRASLSELLVHARRYFSDAAIASDLDVLLDAASSKADRAALRRYAELRQNAPGFSRGDRTSNNHDAIGYAGPGSVQHECQGCGRRFAATRSALYCSGTCRVRAHRRRP